MNNYELYNAHIKLKNIKKCLPSLDDTRPFEKSIQDLNREMKLIDNNFSRVLIIQR